LAENSPGVAVVTGAGRKRIGWHVVQALARRGYAVAIHYNRSATEAQETVALLTHQGLQAAAFQADLTDESAVERMAAEVVNRFGRVDVLVNTAAIWERKRLEEVTAADLRRHLEINTVGTFVCSRTVGLRMVAQPSGGNIITIGDWAIVRPYLDYAAYFPSKGAIPALTRSLAVELGTRNPKVRVNCILPGPVMLPEDMTPQERAEVVRATLVKREGSPEHIVQTVLFFLDNDFLTGVCLPVDGGRTIYAGE
jgi:pteridine reductase